MKTTSLKTIYFTKDELKEAMVAYLVTQGEQELSQFLVQNASVVNWSGETEELIVSVGSD